MSFKKTNKNVIDLRKGVPSAPPAQQQIHFTPAAQPPRLKSNRARVSPVRVRRRRGRYIVLGISAALLALLVFGVSWVSYLPRYNVTAVTIVGTQSVASTDVYNFVESLLHTPGHPFLSRNNIFLYKPDAIEAAVVAHYPRVSSVTVSRASLFATDITVTVQERQSYALWCQSPQAGTDDSHTDCYEMDNSGFIFAPTTRIVSTIDSTSSDATSTDQTTSNTFISSSDSIRATQTMPYIFQGGLGFATSTSPKTGSAATSTITDASTTIAMQSVSPSDPIGYTFVGAHMPGIVALLKSLGQSGFAPTGATVENDQDFRVPLHVDPTLGGGTFYIKASFGESPGSIVSNLRLVLASDALAGKESQLQYVDLRFGDKVYYKLVGADETQTQH